MMKGRINLDYERSPDPYDRHRALYLYYPTTEMTGDYTCKVSTLQNDVTATKRMTVFGESCVHTTNKRDLLGNLFFTPIQGLPTSRQNAFKRHLKYLQTGPRMLSVFPSSHTKNLIRKFSIKEKKLCTPKRRLLSKKTRCLKEVENNVTVVLSLNVEQALLSFLPFSIASNLSDCHAHDA